MNMANLFLLFGGCEGCEDQKMLAVNTRIESARTWIRRVHVDQPEAARHQIRHQISYLELQPITIR
jgi:hypothetical protein